MNFPHFLTIFSLHASLWYNECYSETQQKNVSLTYTCDCLKYSRINFPQITGRIKKMPKKVVKMIIEHINSQSHLNEPAVIIWNSRGGHSNSQKKKRKWNLHYSHCVPCLPALWLPQLRSQKWQLCDLKTPSNQTAPTPTCQYIKFVRDETLNSHKIGLIFAGMSCQMAPAKLNRERHSTPALTTLTSRYLAATSILIPRVNSSKSHTPLIVEDSFQREHKSQLRSLRTPGNWSPQLSKFK